MNNSWSSIAERLIEQASLIYETQPLFIALVLLLKLTLLLGFAWSFHVWIGEHNPIWRQLMWRTTSVGLVLLLMLTALPPLVSLEILPIEDNVGPVKATSKLPTTSPTEKSRQPATLADNSIPIVPTRGTLNAVLQPTRNDKYQPIHLRQTQTNSTAPTNLVETEPQVHSELLTGRSLDAAAQRSEEAIAGWISLERLYTAVWLAGCIFVFTRIMAGWYFLRRIKHESRPVPESLAQLVQRTAGGMKLQACPRVVSTTRVDTPCLSGLINPVILLPTAIVEKPGEADMASVIAHECAHMQRNDLLWNAVWQGFTALLWFHPLVWRARLAHVDSCDGVVDARVSDHFDNREQYCRTLALLALRARSTVPVTSLGMARNSTVRKRIEQLKSGFPVFQLSARQAAVFVGFSMLVVVLLGSLTISRVVATSTTESSSAAISRSISGLKDDQHLNAPAPITSQQLLPACTQGWLSVPDVTRLDKKFLETQIGKLTQNEELAPFIESLSSQFQGWLNDKNVRLGLKIDDVQGVRSGEICIASILPRQFPAGAEQVAPDSHGLVLLVDVSGNLDEARDLMDRVSERLIDRGASKENFSESVDAQVYKWKFPNQPPGKKHRYAYHTITGGWLLSSDNEASFRKILQKLVNIDSVNKEHTLASHPAFQSVMNKIELQGIEPAAYWYVNPFGCIQLAQAIARERQEFKQTNNEDWVWSLKKIDFDGFKGVGGFFTFATDEHEMLHRTFVFKPVDTLQDIKQKRVFGLFDFKNTRQSLLTPPAFAPVNASRYFCASWDMQRALKNVGHAIEAFTRKEGSFNDALDTMHLDLQVDIPKVVENFDNEFMVISDSEMPGEIDSERIVFAIRLKGNPGYVIDNIKKSWPYQHKLVQFQGTTIVEIGEDKFDLDWKDPFDEPSEDKFEERYCATSNGYLFVANNMDYLKGILQSNHEMPISESGDYLRIAKSLEKITDGTKISFRQFSRLDRVVRPNYEKMRSGKLVASDAILARLINCLFEPNKGDPKLQKRTQQVDGSKLPADYDLHVAPYLGPSGWVMEMTDDGWLFTGVVLNRQ